MAAEDPDESVAERTAEAVQDYMGRIFALHESLADEVQVRQQAERTRDRCQAENTRLVLENRDLRDQLARATAHGGE